MGGRNLLIAVLILLAACGPAINTIPTSEYVPPYEPPAESKPVISVDQCQDVTCPEGQTCREGECTCSSSKKVCGEECIDKDECCTSEDCSSGYCKEGVCFAAEECKYGEVLKSGECDCGPDMKLCPEQNKCIKREACCIHGQCSGAKYERCVPTGWTTRFCLETNEKEICRSLADNNREEYLSLEESLRVKATDWWSDGSITFTINNESIRIDEGKTQKYNNITIFHEGIEATGGFCKEDDVE